LNVFIAYYHIISASILAMCAVAQDLLVISLHSCIYARMWVVTDCLPVASHMHVSQQRMSQLHCYIVTGVYAPFLLFVCYVPNVAKEEYMRSV